jgi:Tetratricopeptide repeat
MMHLEPMSRQVFELVHGADRDIRAYRRVRSQENLETALSKLESALNAEPDCLRVRYYHAVANDLGGRINEAVQSFEAVLDAIEGGPAAAPLTGVTPALIHEVRYNFGVALYHHYSWSYLDRAIEKFNQVVREASNRRLRLLARAGRAQAYAMHMIPPDPTHADRDVIQRFFKLNAQEVATLKRGISIPRRLGLDRDVRAEIEWAAYNARGMALMYYADFFGEEPAKKEEQARGKKKRGEEKLALLGDALTALEHAEQVRPRDWANWCDLGSVHMRLAYYSEDPKEYDRARQYLKKVVDSLRSNYGFALYEIGRTYRLQGNHDAAEDYLGQASAIPVQDRDVGNERIELEKRRNAEERAAADGGAKKRAEYP